MQRLTLVFMIRRASNLRVELGAHLLEQIRETTARLRARSHTAMRVVHVGNLSSCVARSNLVFGVIQKVVDALRNPLGGWSR